MGCIPSKPIPTTPSKSRQPISPVIEGSFVVLSGYKLPDHPHSPHPYPYPSPSRKTSPSPACKPPPIPPPTRSAPIPPSDTAHPGNTSKLVYSTTSPPANIKVRTEGEGKGQEIAYRSFAAGYLPLSPAPTPALAAEWRVVGVTEEKGKEKGKGKGKAKEEGEREGEGRMDPLRSHPPSVLRRSRHPTHL